MPGPDAISYPAELPAMATLWQDYAGTVVGQASLPIAARGIESQPSTQATVAVHAAVTLASGRLASRTTTASTNVTTADATFVATETIRETALRINSLLR